MDLLKELREMKETIATELAEANQRIRKSGGDLNTADVDIIDKLTHTMKSLATTCAMLESEEGYSGYGSYYSGREEREGGSSREYRGGGSSREYRYDGMSGRNNRNSYGNSYANRYNRGYSRNGDIMEHLHMMIDEAPDESTRMEIKRLMDKLNNR